MSKKVPRKVQKEQWKIFLIESCPSLAANVDQAEVDLLDEEGVLQNAGGGHPHAQDVLLKQYIGKGRVDRVSDWHVDVFEHGSERRKGASRCDVRIREGEGSQGKVDIGMFRDFNAAISS